MRSGPTSFETVRTYRYLFLNMVRSARYLLARWIMPAGGPPWADPVSRMPWPVGFTPPLDRAVRWDMGCIAWQHEVAKQRYSVHVLGREPAEFKAKGNRWVVATPQEDAFDVPWTTGR